MAHAQTYFWVMNMGEIKFSDGAKLDVGSKHMILDSGLTYALVPSEDFNKLTDMLDKNYGVKCKAAEKKEGQLAQVNPSSCSCKDYNALPELSLKILQTQDDKKGKFFSMPRETYIQDKGNGTCKLLLNPNDM